MPEEYEVEWTKTAQRSLNQGWHVAVIHMHFNSKKGDYYVNYFRKLPNRIQQQARKNYKIWKQNPYHPSLEFKQVHQTKYTFHLGIFG